MRMGEAAAKEAGQSVMEHFSPNDLLVIRKALTILNEVFGGSNA